MSVSSRLGAGDDGATQLIARVDPEARWQGGQGATVRVDDARWHVFDQDGTALN